MFQCLVLHCSDECCKSSHYNEIVKNCFISTENVEDYRQATNKADIAPIGKV